MVSWENADISIDWDAARAAWKIITICGDFQYVSWVDDLTGPELAEDFKYIHQRFETWQRERG